MNIHEHQAKEILKKFGAKVPNGVPVFSLDEIEEKAKLIKSEKMVVKAQIHSGGRGKAGGIKLVNSVEELKNEVVERACEGINYYLSHDIEETMNKFNERIGKE